MNKKIKYFAMAMGLSVVLIGCNTQNVNETAENTETSVEQDIEDLGDKVEEKAEDVKDATKEKIADLNDVVVPTEEDIYRPELLDRALEDLGVTKDDIILISEEYEVADVYETKFLYNGKKYEYEIDYSGQIVKFKEEVENDEYVIPEVSFEDAIQMALEKAGIQSTDLRKLDIELDEAPDNYMEIKLKTQHDKFEYRVDAKTGDIVVD